MRIQHNISALNSYRQLGNNNNALSKNLEKLSSGYRINRAGDDAAGLAISEKMRSQIKGLEAATKNANDGISLVQTAEGALTEVHSMLNRMTYLATQSANGTYDNEVDRANLQKEVTSLLSEVDRISESTNYNGINLLDGSLSDTKINVSAATIKGTKADATTVAATGTASTFKVAAGTDGKDATMKVEYLDASGKSHTVNVDYKASNTLADNVNAISKALSDNGELSGIFDIKADTGTGEFTLTSKATGEKGAKLVSVDTGDVALGKAVATTTGANEKVEVSADGIQAGDKLTINGTTYEFVTDASKKPTTDGATAVLLGADAGAAVANLNKALEGSGLEVAHDTGNKKMVFTAAKDGQGLKLQIGDTAEEFNKLTVSVGDMSAKSLGIAGVDISTQDGAAKAIGKIKTAINTVSSTRGDLGAVQNRLEHTINNLGVTTENMTAAESRIRDTDMAEEMMSYTKNNILIQAAQAMLAQANQVPQGVLQLLQ